MYFINYESVTAASLVKRAGCAGGSRSTEMRALAALGAALADAPSAAGASEKSSLAAVFAAAQVTARFK